MFRMIAFWVLILFLFPVSVKAHRITTFAYVSGKTVHTETYFSDGTPARKANVLVFLDGSKKPILTGKTDKDGRFSFKVPEEARRIKIVVNAEMGHRSVCKLDLKGMSETSPTTEKRNPKEAKSTTPSPQDERLREIIDEELDKRLNPLMEKLVKIEEQMSKPSLRDVFGGIGYIVGIFGLLALIKGEKHR